MVCLPGSLAIRELPRDGAEASSLPGSLAIRELPRDGAEASSSSMREGWELCEAQDVFGGALASKLPDEIFAPVLFKA